MVAELARPVLNVGIITTNFDSMARFYTGLFGFEPLRPLVFPGSGTVHRFKAGESILRLMVPEEAPGHDGASGEFLSATGYRYMTVEVANMDEIVAAVESFGGSVAGGPVAIRPHVKVVQLRDPDGNWMELVQEG